MLKLKKLARSCLELIRFFIVLVPALITKIFVRDLWLISENVSVARDNGYWLFKYIREHQPKQRVSYVINKKSPDYQRVSCLGNVIHFGGWAHWFWYVVADKIVSTQKGCSPYLPVSHTLQVRLRVYPKKIYFLQHGVIKDEATWITYPKARFRMFSTSGIEEYRFVCETFGYPEGYVQPVGLCRFDNLNNDIKDENQILIMPTWRRWLQEEDISDSNYCKQWNAVLNSKELHSLLERTGKNLVFYPHHNMQKYVDSFSTSSDRITIADWERYNVQTLLKSASLLITDYSSVFFDFAYMNKPIIFYQFDEAEFRENQYAKGYFDYHNNSLSVWTGNLQELLAEIERSISSNFASKESASSTFIHTDNQNCARTYQAIATLS